MTQDLATYLRFKALAWIFLLILPMPWSAQAQEAELKQLNQKVGELYKQGSYQQATIIAARALSVAERFLSPEHPGVAASLNDLALLYATQGRYAEAEPLYKRSLAIREKAFGAEHPYVATSLNNIGLLYVAQGQYAQAEPLYKRSLAIREKALGAEHPNVATSLNNLASLYRAQGQFAQAEALCKRALAIQEMSLGANHPDVARSLDSLAVLYKTLGQYGLAEPLSKRSLTIREKSLGTEHPEVATSLNNLAMLYQTQRQYAQAELLLKRSLAIREKVFGANHSEVAITLNNLATVHQAQGHYAQAELLYTRSLAIAETNFGAEHPVVATNLNNLALLYAEQGRYAQAESLYKRSLAIREKALSTNHPYLAASLNELAALYRVQGQYGPALGLTRRASAVYRRRIVAAGIDDSARAEASAGQHDLFRHLSLLALNPYKEQAANVTDEALQIVQLLQSSGTGSAIAKMAARFASGSDALAQLAKRKQDAVQRRNKDEDQLVKASSRPTETRDSASEQRLREAVAQTSKDLELIDAELTARFPAYQELSRPEPLTVGQIQSLMHPGEALLVYALDEISYVWVVTPAKASFRLLPVKIEYIGAHVAKVRSQMEFDDKGLAPKVSVDLLHELYKNLFAPILPELAGASHVMVVPSGPLQSLPMGMLVSTTPPEIKSETDYRNVQWLVRNYAFSVLPSVSSIRAFRQFAKTERASEPFAGFGDPVIGKGSSPKRGVRAKLDMAAVFRSVATANANGPASTSGAEIADVEFIRRTPRLPETSDELRSMATSLRAGSNSVWLQEQATETRAKVTDLSKYRTLAFATHGALAGEVKGVGEPGLVLTPPAVGSSEDDGYLSASEVAKLNLNADWVVLSACNTAAADGTPGAEGLSGMAKAFFYAGARSLLVSHWPVASEATVPLTTVMFQELATNPKLGKAQAQRRAILALINTAGHPEYAHPLFWAPFVVVGEGGSELRGQ